VHLLVFDESHHTAGQHPYVKVADLYRREASVRSGHTQVLALTATIGGASTLDASVERIIKLEDAFCCSIVSLSPAAQEELDQHTSKAAETIVDIPLCEAEVWLMQTLRTISNIMKSTERKSEDGSAKILKEVYQRLSSS
jgi:ERCC4-related helicase